MDVFSAIAEPSRGEMLDMLVKGERPGGDLVKAFPDIHFSLQDIVIGPQGVCEEAVVTATHKTQWLKYSPTNRRLEFKVIIFFPWDPMKKKFKGEKIYLDSIERLIGPT